MKQIKIVCNGTSVAPLEDFVPTQGDLKFLSPENKTKLKKDIIDRGFSFPFFVWENNNKLEILDGHQRALCLLELRDEGWHIPHLPYCEFLGGDEDEARRMLLQTVSQYGITTEMGLMTYLDQYKIDPNEVRTTVEIRDVDWEKIAKDWNSHPDFTPGTEDQQGQLDEKQIIILECPSCGHKADKTEFSAVEN